MKKEIREFLKKIGKKGGQNRMASMTEEMKREFSMKGVYARRINKEKRLEQTRDA